MSVARCPLANEFGKLFEPPVPVLQVRDRLSKPFMVRNGHVNRGQSAPCAFAGRSFLTTSHIAIRRSASSEFRFLFQSPDHPGTCGYHFVHGSAVFDPGMSGPIPAIWPGTEFKGFVGAGAGVPETRHVHSIIRRPSYQERRVLCPPLNSSQSSSSSSPVA